jgi:hypothetical protein
MRSRVTVLRQACPPSIKLWLALTTMWSSFVRASLILESGDVPGSDFVTIKAATLRSATVTLNQAGSDVSMLITPILQAAEGISQVRVECSVFRSGLIRRRRKSNGAVAVCRSWRDRVRAMSRRARVMHTRDMSCSSHRMNKLQAHACVTACEHATLRVRQRCSAAAQVHSQLRSVDRGPLQADRGLRIGTRARA